MTKEPATAARRAPIRLTRAADKDEAVRGDLSAATTHGPDLWTANDEFARVERLTLEADGGFGAHASFAIADYVDLPEGRGEEMDIEGLAVDEGYLWIVGSHSRTRKKPKSDENDAATVLDRLSELKDSPNRYFLGRLALLGDGDQPGSQRPARQVELDDAAPARMAGALRYRKRKGNDLRALLMKDEHLAPFMEVPAKENGFDVEGLAVKGERVFIGLRGPVLRGWAIVVEVGVRGRGDGSLKLAKLGDGGCYRKHFLDLGGLGVRELRRHGDHVLILAGPTMDLDGPVYLYLWPSALKGDETAAVVTRDDLVLVAALPYGEGVDHPEGLALMEDETGRVEVLILYDTPSKDRQHDDGVGLDADVFHLPEIPSESGSKKHRKKKKDDRP